MAYYDIKEIKYKIKRGGGTMCSSYCGSVSSKRPLAIIFQYFGDTVPLGCIH